MTSLLHPPLPDALQPRVRWHQLYGSAAALALAEAAAAERRILGARSSPAETFTANR
jgi:hypothetical protein